MNVVESFPVRRKLLEQLLRETFEQCEAINSLPAHRMTLSDIQCLQATAILANVAMAKGEFIRYCEAEPFDVSPELAELARAMFPRFAFPVRQTK